ncbi:MAG: hypothetical protein H0U21_12205 [Acidimicrobiia bacterium]|nr:hypothetical protein [Acidimicrobiia bacterium]
MPDGQINEIADRLRSVRSGWILVILATAAAAVVATLLSFPVDSTYHTNAVVGPDPEATSSNSRVDYLTDLRVAMFTRSVVQSVADEVGLARTEVSDHLSLRRIDESNLLRVTYDAPTPDPEVASQIVERIPLAAIAFLEAPRLEAAQATLDEAQQTYDEAATAVDESQAATDAAVAGNENVPPNVALASLQDELSDLQVRLLTTDRVTDAGVYAQLELAIDELEPQIGPAAAAAAEYETLQRTRDAALIDRRAAQDDLTVAQDAVRTITIDPTVTVQQVAVEHSRMREAILQVVVVAALAFLVSTVVVTFLANRRRRRSPAASGAARAA